MPRDAVDLRTHLAQSLGHAYAIERELGGGGMSRVFLAEETALGRRVVVKVLAPELAEGLSAERFTREVRLAARLQHPNILPVFAAGVAGGVPYYTMPFVEGESLRARLEAGERIPLPEAVAILRDVARALAHAHQQGVVHRDIKPENVLLSSDAAVVADFGIAKAVDAARAANSGGTLTQLGTAIGTPAYMAPEQAVGDAVDPRADLYAWGVVAYEMLAGRHPFAEKRTAPAVIAAHLAEAPPPLHLARPGLPTHLASLVSRCLAKAPDERPATARELVELLGRLTPVGADDEAPRQADGPSIAVLPFVNLSADPENEYFSDGVSEEVLSVLAQDRGLRVAARSSSFAFKGKRADLRMIADQLRVATLLEGSVRRAGNRVRITAQLVSAADGYQLWSDRFDRELTDIFAVQDEIAGAIAGTLRRMLREGPGGAAPTGAGAPPARRARPPVDVAAYEEYLKGRYELHRRAEGMQQARTHFERALALDPDFAAAHAGLAHSYLWLGTHAAVPPAEAFARMRRHAEQALSLDPELPDAHYLLGYTALWYDWDATACERHVRRALTLEANSPDALVLLAYVHYTRRRRGDALAAAEAALRVDPLGLGTGVAALTVYYLAADFARAITLADRILEEHPDSGEARRFRGMATYTSGGDLALARADLEAAAARMRRSPFVLTHLAMVRALAGEPAEARRLRDELVERAAREWVPPITIALAELALGDYDAAFDWLERAYQARDFLLVWLHVGPMFQIAPPGRSYAIADDPRFAALVRRVGVAPD